MFYRYVTAREGEEEVLYLYFDTTYEFAQDLQHKNQQETMQTKVDNYIHNRGIKFKGNKVYLVNQGIVVGTLYSKQDGRTYQETRPSVTSYLAQQLQTTSNRRVPIERDIVLQKQNGDIVTMQMEEYLLGVLSCEVFPYFHLEMLKAQAVLARTYALKEMFEKGLVLALNEIQIYQAPSYNKLIWYDHYHEYIDRLKLAIQETKGQYLAYQNYYITPYYHLVGNGQTENASIIGDANQNYLKSVSSSGDLESPSYMMMTTLSVEEICERLHITREDLEEIQILGKSRGNRIERMVIGNQVLEGYRFKSLLGLPSQDFTMTIDGDMVKFTTRGYGHGIGLSQYGANDMAMNGFRYHQILAHYYPNTTLFELV